MPEAARAVAGVGLGGGGIIGTDRWQKQGSSEAVYGAPRADADHRPEVPPNPTTADADRPSRYARSEVARLARSRTGHPFGRRNTTRAPRFRQWISIETERPTAGVVDTAAILARMRTLVEIRAETDAALATLRRNVHKCELCMNDALCRLHTTAYRRIVDRDTMLKLERLP
jgi:hypothetical protein